MILPRQLVHRGVVLAHGLLLEGPEASARALACWAPGAQLWRVGEALALRWRDPRRLRADQAEGAPLLLLDEVLWAFPPSLEERKAIGAPRGSLVLALGAEAHVRALGRPIPPRELLSVTLTVLPLADLGAPPAPPPVAAPAPPLDRARFGQAPAHPEAPAVLAELMAAGKAGSLARSPPPGVAVVAGLGAALGAVLRRAGATSAGPGLMSRLLDWLDRTALAGLLRSNLRGRYADYLSQLLDDLDHGDLDRALRTAIPLSDEPDDGQPGGLDMRLPSPRTELRVEPAGGGQSPMSLAAELFEDLRERYKRVAERLQREGRFEDAAFVLAELLGQAEPAVLMLERNGRFALAADIAEARKLSVARQVALRLRAGEVERAMDLARRGGVMLEAARMLESTAPELARQLILARVAILAGTGRLLNALSLLPMGKEPTIEHALLRVALDQSEFLMVALTERFLADPQLRDLWIARARQLLDRGESNEVLERLLLELARLNQGGIQSLPQHRRIAALCRDGARIAARESTRDGEVNEDTVKSLAAFSPAMAEDSRLAPPTEAPQRLVHLTRRADERGALPIFDAVESEDRSILLALGEAGLELRTPGKPPGRFAVPAERVLRLGDQVIAMMRRGEVCELTRADLRTGERSHWLDLRADRPPPLLTRGMLLVAEETGLALYDPVAPSPRALWRGGPKAAVERLGAGDGTSMFAVVWEDGQRELWRWSREDLLLRERTPLPEALPNGAVDLSAEGMVLEAAASPTEPVLAVRTLVRNIKQLTVREHPAVPLPAPCRARPLLVHGSDVAYIVALAREEGGVLVLRFPIPSEGKALGPPAVALTLLGARTVGVGMVTWNSWTVWDDPGRVLRLGARGGVTRELRS